MYTFESRIRFSETGAGGALTLSGLLDYYQDCVTFHAQQVGLPHEALLKKEMAWVIMRWQVEMLRMPRVGEWVRVRTTPYRFGGFAGLRAFAMTDLQGNLLSRADSMWAMMNVKTGRPCRVPQDVAEQYGVGSVQPLEWQAPALHPAERYGSETENLVRPEMLDVNGHMNNVWYLRLAESLLADAAGYGRLCVEYKKSAMPGDPLKIGLNQGEKSVQADFLDAEGNPYAMVWFGKSAGEGNEP